MLIATVIVEKVLLRKMESSVLLTFFHKRKVLTKFPSSASQKKNCSLRRLTALATRVTNLIRLRRAKKRGVQT